MLSFMLQCTIFVGMKTPRLTVPDLTAALNPLGALPKLKFSLADLARARRTFGALVPGMAPEAGSTVLEEVSGFGANPGALRLFRYVPPGLPRGAPLVVVLHGCTQDAAGFDCGTGWSTLARRHGFVLLYPEQQRSNNANLCFNWFEPGDVTRGQGEVASIHNMIAATAGELGIDRRRVFVTGLSAGGAMASAMLATYPETFAAGAIIGGLPYGVARNTSEALSLMYHPAPHPAAELGDTVRRAGSQPAHFPIVSIWHGEADGTVVPANATEQAKQWCDVHGLGEAQASENVVDGASHRFWRDRSGMVRVELYTVPGLGHGVPIDPSGAGEQGVGTPMPYILESGVSSTWRIAKSWGLLGR